VPAVGNAAARLSTLQCSFLDHNHVSRVAEKVGSKTVKAAYIPLFLQHESTCPMSFVLEKIPAGHNKTEKREEEKI
jgi:hypothetical protein